MEKQITLTLPESKARILMDEAYVKMQELDLLYEKKSLEKRQKAAVDSEGEADSFALERMKRTADVMEEVFESLRGQIHS